MAVSKNLIAGAAALTIAGGSVEISKESLGLRDNSTVETKRELLVASTQFNLANLLDTLGGLIISPAYAGIPGKNKINEELAELKGKEQERGAKADERGAKADERGAKADEFNKNIDVIGYAITHINEVKSNSSKMSQAMKAIEYIENNASSIQNPIERQNALDVAKKARIVLK